MVQSNPEAAAAAAAAAATAATVHHIKYCHLTASPVDAVAHDQHRQLFHRLQHILKVTQVNLPGWGSKDGLIGQKLQKQLAGAMPLCGATAWHADLAS
jgi:hypothetical protein